MAANLSTNSRKRKIEASSTDCNPKPKKRIRRRSRFKQPQSKLFSTKEDIDRFQEIFHAVKYSELVSDSQIPISIIQEIAEYGNGNVFRCGSWNCDDKVVTLEGDRVSPSGAHEDISYVRAGARWYFCSLCASSELEWCEHCRKYNYIPDCFKCHRCTVAILSCDDSRYFGTDCQRCIYIDCSICESMFCSECTKEADWCQICEEFICSECWADEDNRDVAIFQCDQCPRSLTRSHKECPMDCVLEASGDFIRCSDEKCRKLMCLDCYEDDDNCPRCGPGSSDPNSECIHFFCDQHKSSLFVLSNHNLINPN